MSILSPVFIAFAVAQDPGRGFASWISAFTVVFLTRYLWDLRVRVWFWLLLGLVVAGHAFLIVSISIPVPAGGKTRALLVMLLPFAGVHFLMVRGLFWFAEVMLGGGAATTNPAPTPTDPTRLGG